jgi:hypothetical protein
MGRTKNFFPIIASLSGKMSTRMTEITEESPRADMQVKKNEFQDSREFFSSWSGLLDSSKEL